MKKTVALTEFVINTKVDADAPLSHPCIYRIVKKIL